MDIHYTGKDRILLIINYILLGLFVLAILLPLVYVVLSSFLTPNTLITKGFAITSSDWTLTGYAKILSNSAMIRGFFNAIFIQQPLRSQPYYFPSSRLIRLRLKSW